jgi:hypothetical protein
LDLNLQLQNTAASVHGQQSRISELMSTLEMSQEEIEAQRDRIRKRDSYFKTAQQVLSEMRPMLAALENQLSEKDKDEL